MIPKINLNSHHIEITDAIHDYAQKRFQKLNKFNNNISHFDVTLTAEKERHKAEVHVHVPGKTLYAEHETDNGIYEAIDKLQTKITKQLTKDKDKRNNYRT